MICLSLHHLQSVAVFLPDSMVPFLPNSSLYNPIYSPLLSFLLCTPSSWPTWNYFLAPWVLWVMKSIIRGLERERKVGWILSLPCCPHSNSRQVTGGCQFHLTRRSQISGGSLHSTLCLQEPFITLFLHPVRLEEGNHAPVVPRLGHLSVTMVCYTLMIIAL